jgi:hypothetical protein
MTKHSKGQESMTLEARMWHPRKRGAAQLHAAALLVSQAWPTAHPVRPLHIDALQK